MRRLLGRPGDRQRGFAEAGVAVTGAALVLGAALGSGVASTVVTMSDGVTWLPDDETGQVVQINPGTGRAERRLQVAGPGSELGISQRDGHLVVTDARTGAVTSIDLATLLAGGQRRTDEPARVLVGGGLVYLVTPSTGVVRAVDPLTLQDLGSPYRVGGELADAVVDARGAVWVVTTAGELRSVTWQPDDERFDVGTPRPVRGAGGATRLLPHERGVTVFAPDGGAVLQVGVGRDLAVAVPDLSGDVLPAASSPTDLAPAGVPGRSAVVMLAGDRILDVGVGALGCRRPGRPAVFAGLVYVPCTGAGRVVVLRPDGTRARPDVVVPGGRDPRLLVDDGRLVVHTEDGARAVVVEADGTTRVVDTGRAQAPVHDPNDRASGPAAAVPPAVPPVVPPTVVPPTVPTQPERLPVPSGQPGGPADPTPDPGATPTGGPEPTRDPGATDAPDPTDDPTTTRPTPTGTPTPTGGPSPTGTPTPTSSPTPTGRPSPTVTPTPTEEPEVTPVRPTTVGATITTAHEDGTADVGVTWRIPSPRPDHYVVRASIAGVAPVQVAGSARMATVRSLVCGRSVTFTVEAVIGDAGATSAASDAVRTPDCPPTAPEPPTGVAAVANADGSVTVSWTPSPSIVENYVLGPEGSSTTVASMTSSSQTLRDLPPGATMRFVVQAVRGSLSSASVPSNAVTVAGPPGAVPGLDATDTTAMGDRHWITLAWGAAPANGSPVTDYVVAWSGGGVSGRTTTTGRSALVEFSCAGQPLCTQGGTVTVTVTARSAVGEGPAASYAYVAQRVVPPPANGDVVVGGVSWQPPDRWDLLIPMTAHLSMPESWSSAGGTCTLQVSVDGVPDASTVPCTSGNRHLGTYPGGATLTVSVRAPNGAVSNSASERVPARNGWAYCDPQTRICTQPVGHDGGGVVVIPLPWTPSLPGGPERPPVLAAGVGLLLAAGALRALRLRRPDDLDGHDDVTAPTPATRTTTPTTTEEPPA